MRKRNVAVITAMLVLICLIFFVTKSGGKQAEYEGILVKRECEVNL